MNLQSRKRIALVLGLLFSAAASRPAYAQPWVVFEDGESDSVCGIVNAAEHELVVLADTGELVIVSDVDVILGGTFVDLDNTVYIDDEPFGFLSFFEDGDDFATLWWVIEPDLRVVGIDQFGGFYESDFFPDDFIDVACSACDFWDDPLDCDEDLDGVPDDFDLCPGTPADEDVDADGCSCFDYDSDEDGVVDCFDLCPETQPDEGVDEDGCSCFDYDSDADGVVDCFDLCPDSLPDDDVDQDGCSCFDYDSDNDSVVDCFDLCPNTPFPAEVDDDGCPFDDDGGTAIILCGAMGAPALAVTFLTLFGLRFIRERQPRRP